MCNVLASTAFLSRFKDLLEQGRVRFDARNCKTRAFMQKYSIYTDDVLEILSALKPREILRGPTADHDGTKGKVMEFIHPWMKIKLYIKIKVVDIADGDGGAILSVHEDEEGHYG